MFYLIKKEPKIWKSPKTEKRSCDQTESQIGDRERQGGRGTQLYREVSSKFDFLSNNSTDSF